MTIDLKSPEDGSAAQLEAPPGRRPRLESADMRQLREQVELLSQRCEQLQTALDSRVVIEQAKGILAERLTVTVDEAFRILRRGARSNRIRLHDLAAAVVASRVTPAELVWSRRDGDSA